MQTQKRLSQFFRPEPARWGLRGDPFLWREMKTTLDNYKFPETEEQLTTLLEQICRQLTGISLTNHEPVFIERDSHGGMSSGYISPQFWGEQAIPMLRTRYRESK